MFAFIILTIVIIFDSVNCHGNLLDPVSRNSLWRYDENAPINYDDNGLNCGGFDLQHNYYSGKCGICGDSYNLPTPRPHEDGGKFGKGTIVGIYYPGDNITTSVRLTANHRGYFKFSLCNLDEGPEDETCFKPLKTTSGEDIFYVKYFLPGIFKPVIQLPNDVLCQHCVFRWTWVAGNNWGICLNGTESVGCGPQENFVNCADIAIFPRADYDNNRTY